MDRAHQTDNHNAGGTGTLKVPGATAWKQASHLRVGGGGWELLPRPPQGDAWGLPNKESGGGAFGALGQLEQRPGTEAEKSR